MVIVKVTSKILMNLIKEINIVKDLVLKGS